MLHQRLLLIASLAISTVALPAQQQSTDFSNVDDSIISAHATLPESAIRRGLEDSDVQVPEVTSALDDEVLLDDEEWVDDESAIDVAIDDTVDLEVPETAAVSDENLDQTVDTIVARARVKKPWRRSESAEDDSLAVRGIVKKPFRRSELADAVVARARVKKPFRRSELADAVVARARVKKPWRRSESAEDNNLAARGIVKKPFRRSEVADAVAARWMAKRPFGHAPTEPTLSERTTTKKPF